MRLRNIPRAEEVLQGCKEVVKNETIHRGAWAEVFKNQNPIQIEVGMGKGRFILEHALTHPDVNYIGIERYSSVLLRAVEKFQELTDPPANLRFICMDAADLPEVFAPGEVSRIYLNFSDPWPKARHARRRLTSLEFFGRYDQILASEGCVEFKTDNRGLFDFSLEQLETSPIFKTAAYTFDLHHDPVLNEGNILTEYEEKFSSLGNPICKLVARRRAEV